MMQDARSYSLDLFPICGACSFRVCAISRFRFAADSSFPFCGKSESEIEPIVKQFSEPIYQDLRTYFSSYFALALTSKL